MGLTFADCLLRDTSTANTFVASHVANDAFKKSLKDLALFPPRSPGKHLETQLRGCLWQVAHYWGQLPPPETDAS